MQSFLQASWAQLFPGRNSVTDFLCDKLEKNDLVAMA